MNKNKYILILTIILVAFSCKKKDDFPYGPCEEVPIGIEPLNFYSVQFGVRSEIFLDAIESVWHRDSVRLYDEFENVIEINWLEDGTGNNITNPIYFFSYTEDSLAFENLVTNIYYIDFHENNFIDRDTLEIKFKVEDVQCGQILNPLEFYQNQILLENNGYITTRRLKLLK